MHDGLLAVLLDDAYYDLPAPKSTGKEHFHGDYVDAGSGALPASIWPSATWSPR